MNAAMEINVIFLLTIAFFASQGLEARYTYGGRPWLPQLPRICNRTSDCDKGQCCRGINGDIVGSSDHGFPDFTLLGPGTCSERLSGPGQPCSGCGCIDGYRCYRTITGVCCPPHTCWRTEEADRDEEYWKNCFSDPKCHLPPSVNPGGGVGGGPQPPV